jgi:acyl-CoA hydrolase
MADKTAKFTDADLLADKIIERLDGKIVMATPLGLGKANHVINAIYNKVRKNPSYSLKIYTALTLNTPQASSDMERRFLEPFKQRLYNGYCELDFAHDLHDENLPNNVEVCEFFLAAGQWLGNSSVQQNYVSANYSHAGGYILKDGINLVVQMLASEENNSNYSLSCNPDITLDLLKARESGKSDFVVVGELNENLPFMPGDAEISGHEIDYLLKGDCESSTLFNIPKRPVNLPEYAAGFYASGLIPDNGTLQIGIGSIGDAVAYALILRQNDNKDYRKIMSALHRDEELERLHLDPFEAGLHGMSEMFVDSFLDLIEGGVIKREVDGILAHGGFFVGPSSLYNRLNKMPNTLRQKINMTRVRFINDAHEGFEEKKSNRENARFINNGMKATLLGAVVSDGLENGQVISGVGGQYDFVRQSFALDGACSLIMLNALRDGTPQAESNIVWSYGHITIPRHLRDIVITEYGAAYLKGANDADVIKRMISVADAQFQDDLIKTAQENGKLSKGFNKPDFWSENTSRHIEQNLTPFREKGLLPEYPFGTDFTATEQRLIKALDKLKPISKSKSKLIKTAWRGFRKKPHKDQLAAIKRMGLDKPHNLDERIKAYLLRAVL